MNTRHVFAALLLALACSCNDARVVAYGGDAAPSGDGDSDASVSADAAPGVAAVPRLIAPMSTSTVTQQRPTLHWVLGAGGGTANVDLCRDRACSQLLTNGVDVAVDQASATVKSPLPAGWIYWRVRMVTGSE